MLSVTVSKNKIYAIIKFLKENSETNFNFLTDLTGIHLPENKEDLGVIYHLHNFYKNHRIRLKIFFSTQDSYVDSIVDLYSGANWMERETFDFFGIHFKGHPNLTRILNMEDMLIHPLRKEFPLEDQSRKDKNDAMFGR
jgi:NADH-quinone oxidoreductase subunit C